MKKVLIKTMSLVLLLAFCANTCCYGLATLPASQNPIAKREILAALQRTQVRYAETEEAIGLLEANDTVCLPLVSGNYLVKKELLGDDIVFLREIVSAETRAILKILANEERNKYDGIVKLIRKHFPVNVNTDFPSDINVDYIVARAFGWLVLIREGVLLRDEIHTKELEFVKFIEPIIKSYKNEYFGKEFWDSAPRKERIRQALANGFRLYQIPDGLKRRQQEQSAYPPKTGPPNTTKTEATIDSFDEWQNIIDSICYKLTSENYQSIFDGAIKIYRVPITMEPGYYRMVIVITSHCDEEGIAAIISYILQYLYSIYPEDKVAIYCEDGVANTVKNSIRRIISKITQEGRANRAIEFIPYLSEQEALSHFNPSKWVYNDENVEQVLAGNFLNVRPHHAEITPIHGCNFHCPHCSFGIWRELVTDDPSVTKMMDLTTMKKTIDILKYQIGVRGILMCGNGEPTLNPWLLDGIDYAFRLGLGVGVYSNGGKLLPEDYIKYVMDRLLFFRISLNAVTPNIHAKFHGLESEEASTIVKDNIFRWAKLNMERGGKFNFSVSIIVNPINASDLVPIAHFLRSVVKTLGGGIKFAVFKPQINMREPNHQYPKEFFDTVLDTLHKQVIPLLEEVGIKPIVNPVKFEDLQEPSREYTHCYGTSWYLTHPDPDGRVYFCTELSGRPEFYIGNIFEQSFEEIWHGQKRMDLLERYPQEEVCPPTCKEHELNTILARIERDLPARKSLIRQWIEDLKRLGKPYPILSIAPWYLVFKPSELACLIGGLFTLYLVYKTVKFIINKYGNSKPAILGGPPLFKKQMTISSHAETVSLRKVVRDIKGIIKKGAYSPYKGGADFYRKRFENAVAKYLGIQNKSVVAVTSAKDALTLLLMGAELGRDGKDEVIVPSYTNHATVRAIIRSGLRPVFADIDKETFNISPESVESLISDKTAAILAVDIFGVPADYKRLQEIASNHSIKFFIDSAESLGATYKGTHTGNFGDGAAISFSYGKIVQTFGKGGVVILSNNMRKALEKDAKAYLYSDLMPEVNAVLGLDSIGSVEQYLEKRRRIAAIYREELGKVPGISCQSIGSEIAPSPLHFAVIVSQKNFGLSRDQLKKALNAEGIEAREFFPPQHEEFPGYRKGDLANTMFVSSNVLCLPIYSDMSERTAHAIAKAVRNIYEHREEISGKISLEEERVVVIPVVDIGATNTRIGLVQRQIKGNNFIGEPVVAWFYSQRNPTKIVSGKAVTDMDKVIDLVVSSIDTAVYALKRDNNFIEVVKQLGISSPGAWLENGLVYSGSVPNIPDLEKMDLSKVLRDRLCEKLGYGWEAYVNNDGIANVLTGVHYLMEDMKRGKFPETKETLDKAPKIIGFFPGTGFGSGGFFISHDTIEPMPGPQQFFDIVARQGKGRFLDDMLVCEDIIGGDGLANAAKALPVFQKFYPPENIDGVTVAEATEHENEELREAAIQIFKQVAVDISETMIKLYDGKGKKAVLNEPEVEKQFWTNVKGCRIFIFGGWLADRRCNNIIMPVVKDHLRKKGYGNITIVEADQISGLEASWKNAGLIGASFFTPYSRGDMKVGNGNADSRNLSSRICRILNTHNIICGTTMDTRAKRDPARLAVEEQALDNFRTLFTTGEVRAPYGIEAPVKDIKEAEDFARNPAYASTHKTLHFLTMTMPDGSDRIFNLTNLEIIKQIKDLHSDLYRIINILKPANISLHLGYASRDIIAKPGERYINASSPLPREEALETMVASINVLKKNMAILGIDVPVLIETLDYVFDERPTPYDLICEPDFVKQVLERTSTDLLVDCSHLFISGTNFAKYHPEMKLRGYMDYVKTLINENTIGRIKEIHVAIPEYDEVSGLWLDRHLPFNINSKGNVPIKAILNYILNLRASHNIELPLLINFETGASEAEKEVIALAEFLEYREAQTFSEYSNVRMSANKIKSNAELRRITDDLRKEKKKTVLVMGNFETINKDLIEVLAKAKEGGDVLVAAVKRNAMRTEKRDEGHAINGELARALALSVLGFVDYITICEPESANKVIEELMPDVIIEEPQKDKNLSGKIKSRSEIRKIVSELKQQGKKIVFSNGVFDVLHGGHVNLLIEAKKMGDILIVAINSDNSTKRIKGESRPIYNEQDRAFMLSALDAVDYVTVFEEDSSAPIIEELVPDVLVKGGDYRKEDIVGAQFVEASGGQVCIIPYAKGYSTTSTIKTIIQKNQDSTTDSSKIPKDLSRGHIDELQETHPAVNAAANEGRMFAITLDQVGKLQQVGNESLADLLISNLIHLRSPPATRQKLLKYLQDASFREKLLKGFTLMHDSIKDKPLPQDKPIRLCIVIEDENLPTIVFKDAYNNLIAHSGKGEKTSVPYISIYAGYNSLEVALKTNQEDDFKKIINHEASDIARGYHLDEKVTETATLYDNVLDLYDAQSATVLLTDILYTQLHEDRIYEVKYDASRLTTSQIEIIEEYVRLLQLRSSNPDNIKLRPFSSAQGSKESLIAVYCTGKDFRGEGHVDVAIPDGELKEYLLRITGMVNIALASSNIPDNLSKEDVDKYRPLTNYIKNQYKAILGEELAIPDSPEDILKVIRRIVLGLPKSMRMNTDQIEEFNRLAKQALTAA